MKRKLTDLGSYTSSVVSKYLPGKQRTEAPTPYVLNKYLKSPLEDVNYYIIIEELLTQHGKKIVEERDGKSFIKGTEILLLKKETEEKYEKILKDEINPLKQLFPNFSYYYGNGYYEKYDEQCILSHRYVQSLLEEDRKKINLQYALALEVFKENIGTPYVVELKFPMRICYYGHLILTKYLVLADVSFRQTGTISSSSDISYRTNSFIPDEFFKIATEIIKGTSTKKKSEFCNEIKFDEKKINAILNKIRTETGFDNVGEYSKCVDFPWKDGSVKSVIKSVVKPGIKPGDRETIITTPIDAKKCLIPKKNSEITIPVGLMLFVDDENIFRENIYFPVRNGTQTMKILTASDKKCKAVYQTTRKFKMAYLNEFTISEIIRARQNIMDQLSATFNKCPDDGLLDCILKDYLIFADDLNKILKYLNYFGLVISPTTQTNVLEFYFSEGVLSTDNRQVILERKFFNKHDWQFIHTILGNEKLPLVADTDTEIYGKGVWAAIYAKDVVNVYNKYSQISDDRITLCQALAYCLKTRQYPPYADELDLDYYIYIGLSHLGLFEQNIFSTKDPEEYSKMDEKIKKDSKIITEIYLIIKKIYGTVFKDYTITQDPSIFKKIFYALTMSSEYKLENFFDDVLKLYTKFYTDEKDICKILTDMFQLINSSFVVYHSIMMSNRGYVPIIPNVSSDQDVDADKIYTNMVIESLGYISNMPIRKKEHVRIHVIREFYKMLVLNYSSYIEKYQDEEVVCTDLVKPEISFETIQKQKILDKKRKQTDSQQERSVRYNPYIKDKRGVIKTEDCEKISYAKVNFKNTNYILPDFYTPMTIDQILKEISPEEIIPGRGENMLSSMIDDCFNCMANTLSDAPSFQQTQTQLTTGVVLENLFKMALNADAATSRYFFYIDAVEGIPVIYLLDRQRRSLSLIHTPGNNIKNAEYYEDICRNLKIKRDYRNVIKISRIKMTPEMQKTINITIMEYMIRNDKTYTEFFDIYVKNNLESELIDNAISVSIFIVSCRGVEKEPWKNFSEIPNFPMIKKALDITSEQDIPSKLKILSIADESKLGLYTVQYINRVSNIDNIIDKYIPVLTEDFPTPEELKQLDQHLFPLVISTSDRKKVDETTDDETYETPYITAPIFIQAGRILEYTRMLHDTIKENHILYIFFDKLLSTCWKELRTTEGYKYTNQKIKIKILEHMRNVGSSEENIEQLMREIRDTSSSLQPLDSVVVRNYNILRSLYFELGVILGKYKNNGFVISSITSKPTQENEDNLRDTINRWYSLASRVSYLGERDKIIEKFNQYFKTVAMARKITNSKEFNGKIFEILYGEINIQENVRELQKCRIVILDDFTENQRIIINMLNEQLQQMVESLVKYFEIKWNTINGNNRDISKSKLCRIAEELLKIVVDNEENIDKIRVLKYVKYKEGKYDGSSIGVINSLFSKFLLSIPQEEQSQTRETKYINCLYMLQAIFKKIGIEQYDNEDFNKFINDYGVSYYTRLIGGKILKSSITMANLTLNVVFDRRFINLVIISGAAISGIVIYKQRFSWYQWFFSDKLSGELSENKVFMENLSETIDELSLSTDIKKPKIEKNIFTKMILKVMGDKDYLEIISGGRYPDTREGGILLQRDKYDMTKFAMLMIPYIIPGSLAFVPRMFGIKTPSFGDLLMYFMTTFISRKIS